jgi:hypothetical protein
MAKLVLTEYVSGGEINRDTFFGTDVTGVIDTWAIWNDNEKFDFRMPTAGTRDFLVAHLHNDGDSFYLGTVTKSHMHPTFAFRFMLTDVGSKQE